MSNRKLVCFCLNGRVKNLSDSPIQIFIFNSVALKRIFLGLNWIFLLNFRKVIYLYIYLTGGGLRTNVNGILHEINSSEEGKTNIFIFILTFLETFFFNSYLLEILYWKTRQSLYNFNSCAEIKNLKGSDPRIHF